MKSIDSLIAQLIDYLSKSVDLSSKESLADNAKRYTLAKWKRITIAKVVGVGFLTGIPGGLAGGALAALDMAYLFGAAGRGCYGIGHILNREIDRDKDLRLIIACWCGAASAVSTVTAGKVAIKVFGKAALPATAGFAAKVLTKASFKAGGKFMGKLGPQIASKLAGQLAGKAGSMVIPFLGAAVSSAISYWVASSLMDAADSYYRSEFVQFDDPDITIGDLVEEVADIGQEMHS